MPTKITNPTDPDGQAVMEVLTDLEVPANSAYNATLGVRNMAGQNVIAKLDAMETATYARIDAMEAATYARIEALEVATNAHIKALESSTDARIEALEATMEARFDGVDARLDALSTQIDILGWAVMASLAMLTVLSAKTLLGGKK